MKILAGILSVFFLSLNLLPCSDVAAPEGKFEIVEDHENHSFGIDLCSPFCQCHCCHVHVINLQTSDFETVESSISTKIVQKGAFLGEEFPNSHFQPPRI